MKFFGIICAVFTLASAKHLGNQVQTRAVTNQNEFISAFRTIGHDNVKDATRALDKIMGNQPLVDAFVYVSNIGSTFGTALTSNSYQGQESIDSLKAILAKVIDSVKVAVDLAVSRNSAKADGLKEWLGGLPYHANKLNKKIDAITFKVGSFMPDSLTVDVMNTLINDMQSSAKLMNMAILEIVKTL